MGWPAEIIVTDLVGSHAVFVLMTLRLKAEIRVRNIFSIYRYHPRFVGITDLRCRSANEKPTAL